MSESSHSQMGFREPINQVRDLNVRGNLIQGNSYEGDHISAERIIYNTIFQSSTLDPSFDRISIGPFSDKKISKNICDLAEVILKMKQNFTVLLGSYEIGWDRVLFEISWILKKNLELNSPNEIQVFIGNQSSDLDLKRALRKKGYEKSIFILKNLLPSQIKFDYYGAFSVAREKGSFIVANSLAMESNWVKENEKNRRFFKRLNLNDLYSEDFIHNYLSEKLTNFSDPKLDQFKGSKEGEDITRYLAKNLKSRKYIDAFVYELETHSDKESSLKNRQKLKSVIDRIKDHSREISFWWVNLSARNQLIAISLLFFEGMYLDKIFTLANHIYFRDWKNRDPSLRAFDIVDFRYVSEQFTIIKNDKSQTQIRCSGGDDLKQRIINCAWESHQEYILGALPIIVQLLCNSSTRLARTDEILIKFNAVELRQFRLSAADFLSDLGYRYFPAINWYFLLLAGDKSREVRFLAAQIISRWRGIDSKRGLDEIINLTSHLDYGKFKFKRRICRHYGIDEVIFQSNVVATIAIILSNAMLYDVPNKASSFLKDNFVKIIYLSDQDEKLRNQLTDGLISNVISRHWEVFGDDIYEIAKRSQFISEVTKGLSEAHLVSPSKIVRLMDRWEMLTSVSTVLFNNDLELRFKLLVHTLIKIANAYYEDNNSQEFKTVFLRINRYLITIIQNWNRLPQLRQDFFATFCRAVEYLADIETEINDEISVFLYHLPFEEQKNLAIALITKYFKEKIIVSSEEGETFDLKLKSSKSVSYIGINPGIPIRLQPPLTMQFLEVEKNLLKWITIHPDPSMKEFALYVYFNAMQMIELEINLKNENRIFNSSPEIIIHLDKYHLTNRLQAIEFSWLEKITVWQLTLTPEKLKKENSRFLLKYLVYLANHYPDSLHLLIDRWSTNLDDYTHDIIRNFRDLEFWREKIYSPSIFKYYWRWLVIISIIFSLAEFVWLSYKKFVDELLRQLD
ncbi:MAG: hypothetical protein QNJ45_11650 [Ardenticatenaceae bacterium]|nr:hypothetical protein [Ardenticatenaceae bacterium]